MPEIAADVPWPDADAGNRLRAAADPRLGSLRGAIEWLGATAAVLARPRLLVLGAVPQAVAELAADSACAVSSVGPTGYEGGVAAADTAIEEGAGLLLLAAPGAGDSAAIIASVVTGTEPAKVLARGAAAADAGAWMRRAVTVRDGRRRLIALRNEPGEMLDALGDAAVATAVGIALQAAARRTPVVLDGVAAAAAALLAFEAQPRAARWWIAADAGGDPSGMRIAAALGLPAVLGLGVDVADGTAALIALGVLRAAARLVTQEEHDAC